MTSPKWNGKLPGGVFLLPVSTVQPIHYGFAINPITRRDDELRRNFSKLVFHHRKRQLKQLSKTCNHGSLRVNPQMRLIDFFFLNYITMTPEVRLSCNFPTKFYSKLHEKFVWSSNKGFRAKHSLWPRKRNFPRGKKWIKTSPGRPHARVCVQQLIIEIAKSSLRETQLKGSGLNFPLALSLPAGQPTPFVHLWRKGKIEIKWIFFFPSSHIIIIKR